MKSYLLFFLLTINVACNRDKCHNRITFINNSNKDLYYSAGENYPDTNIVDDNPIVDESYKINHHSTGNFTKRSCYEQVFNLTSKKIYFIFDAHVLQTTPWDTVMKKYMIVKRYELTLQGLKDSNWTITYP